MGSVTDRAQELVDLLKTTGEKASTDATTIQLPAFLVVPIPKYTFGNHLDGTSSLDWSIYAIAKQPGNLANAQVLERMVIAAAGVLDFETADPTSYQLPKHEAPFPAYRINISDDLEVGPTP